jgi:hypothetical protein
LTADPAAMRDAAGRFTAVGRHLAAAMAPADAAIVSVECGAPDGRAWLDEATAALTAMRAGGRGIAPGVRGPDRVLAHAAVANR